MGDEDACEKRSGWAVVDPVSTGSRGRHMNVEGKDER